MQPIRLLFLACTLIACRRDEQTVAGEPLSHWASEAKQVSFFSFWNSDKDERRRVAFRHLKEMGEPAVPVLFDLFKSERVPVSADALNALVALGPQARGAVPGLMEIVTRPDSTRRIGAIMILGSIGPDATPAIPALTNALRDSNTRVAQAAAIALAQLGPAGQDAITSAVRHGDAGVRKSALSGFARAPLTAEKTRENVTLALADPAPEVRARAMDVLASSTTATVEALDDLLIRGMRDSSAEVREAARRAFRTAAHDNAPALLVKVMAGGDTESRADAARRLGLALRDGVVSRRSPELQSVIRTALERALFDPDIDVRVYAARSMAMGYPDAKQRAAAKLRRDIPNADVPVRVRGAGTLWEMYHRVDDVEAAFLAGLAAREPWVRVETLGEILKMGAEGKAFIPALERLRNDSFPEVRRRAARLVEMIQERAAGKKTPD